MSNTGHQHHPAPVSTSPLKLGLIITLVMGAVEVVGGVLSHSLALLGDAGHMLVDVLSLALALFAATIARRPVTSQKTYGYHRVEIMAALANGTTLILIAIYILYEAYRRLSQPPPIDTLLMLSIAIIGLVVNIIGVGLTQRASRRNLNVRAAFWHIVGDALSSLGVIVGGIIIAITGANVIDPIIAIFISGIILWGAARLVSESVDILLEAVPKHIEVDKVIETITKIPGVAAVHDIHIWTITSGMHAMSAHLLIEDQMVSRSAEIVETVNQELARDYDIRHTTLQLECQTCPSAHQH